MKILIYTLRFNPLKGGAEKHANFLFKFLKEKGEDVKVVTFKEQGEKILNEKNIIFFRLTGIKIVDSIISFLYGFFYLLFNIKKYNLVLCYLASSNAFLSGIFGKIFRVKVYLRFGASRAPGDIGTSKKKLFGKLKLLVIKKFIDKYIVQSKELKEELIKEGFKAEKIFIIPNGVDVNKFFPLKEEEKNDLKKRLSLNFNVIVNYTGRLNRYKGVLDLIDAFIDLKKQNTALLILGEGELQLEIERIARERKLDNVILKGIVSNPEDYYKISDIFVLPSYGEGMSNALLEAMASGLLCIVTDIGGNNELIEDGINGFLFNPGDRNKLKKILEDVLEGRVEIESLKKRAREKIVNKYNLEKILGMYYKLIKAGVV